MQKICIISNQHLSRNPRVWKEAIFLSNVGYDVTILTVWTTAKTLEEDYTLLDKHQIKYIGAVNLIPNGNDLAKKIFLKVRRRIAIVLKKWLGIENVWILGENPLHIFRAALKMDADLYIAHVEFAFYIGKLLIQANKKVAFDFEDWYSQDYLVPERPIKLLQRLERFALVNGVYCTCPSESMSQALLEHYEIKKDITVIYNGFSNKENVTIIKKYNNNSKPSLVWFSQTIGGGRGLETLLKALEILDIPVNLNLVGEYDKKYDAQLKAGFPFNKKHSLNLYPRVSHSKLLSLIATNDIGLALENKYPGSRDTTITNKILQYMQAGIKTLATNTRGQIEIAAYFPDSIKIVKMNKADEWAENLKTLITSPEINIEKQMETFNKYFSWEAQQDKLIRKVKSVL